MKIRNCKSIAPQLCLNCRSEMKAYRFKVIEYNNEIYTICKFCINDITEDLLKEIIEK